MLTETLDNARIIIVGGSGGVGKTSVSASLGIVSARRGYKTLVLTIDPARRLAGALGLDGIGKEAADVTPRLKDAGLQPKGELYAMMLDVQNTFDRLVERYAPDEATRKQILENRLYQNISTRLSGSQEYASMQRLYEIATEEGYDRIILDTPPTTHALDFLTAPRRLMEFFDSRVMQMFVNVGGKVGWNLFKRGTDVFFKALDRLTGAGLVQEIADFFRIAEAILEPYKDQSDLTEALLRQEQTTFVVVTGPNEHQLDDAGGFRETLAGMGIRVSAVIVNRWLRPRALGRKNLPDPAKMDDELAAHVADWGGKLETVARNQSAAIRQLQEAALIDVYAVPSLDEDVHSIDGLRQIGERLEEKPANVT